MNHNESINLKLCNLKKINNSNNLILEIKKELKRDTIVLNINA